MPSELHDMEVQRALGRIEGELKGLRADIQQHFVDDKQAFSNISKRLHSVERKVWMGQGSAAALGAIIGFLAKYFS